MQIPRKSERLKFFQDLYERAKSYSTEYHEGLTRHLEQYKGSKEIDGSTEEAKTVRNITYEIVESQVTSYLPSAKVTAASLSDQGERLAKSIESLCRRIRDKNPFERLNDLDERYTYIYGGSVWLVEWDESEATHSTVGEVKVSCVSPRHFVGQPGIYQVQEMEYCFISFDTTKEELIRQYGIDPETAEETSSEEISDEDAATIIVCYYKNDEDKICKFAWSDDILLADVDDYYSRKREYCKRCEKKKQLCSCEKPELEVRNEEYEEVPRAIKTQNGVILPECEMIRDGVVVTETLEVPVTDEQGNQMMQAVDGLTLPMTEKIEVPKTEKTKLPFYTPKLFPIVIRVNTSEEDSLFGQSDCEFVRPQQQAINKIESRILEKLLRAGITPVVPEDCSISLNNSVFGQVIKMKPGETAAQYGTIDTTPDISRDIAEAERLYDQAKRQMGISDSFQGQYDASAKSGVAKQAQINQAAGRLDSKRKMKNIAYSDIYEIIFQLYLAYADEPRPSSYVDAYGRTQEIEFNRYDFFKRDEAGEWYIDDRFLFSADTSVDAAYERETLWEINMNNFTSGAYGDPALPESQLTYWLNMERAHYPYAHDNAERLRGIVDTQRILAAQQEMIKKQEALLEEYKGALQKERGEKERLYNLSRNQGELMQSERKIIEEMRGSRE